jgi:glycosyltransferase involved in cell wall biosynthesis
MVARTSSRPRVLHLTTVDMSLALLLLPQLLAIRDAGYDVVGVSAPGPYVPLLASQGIRHVPLERSTRSADVFADVAAAREFVAVCQRLQPDIVHTHNPKPGVYGRIGARIARVPHVVNTVHGLYAQPADRLARRVAVYGLERTATMFSDAELIQNPEDFPVLRRLGVPARKLHILGNGIDLARFDPDRPELSRDEARAELGSGPEEVVIGAVGRLVAEKGYRELFEAFTQVRSRQPRARLVIAGPRDDDKPDAITDREIAAAAEKAGVRFLGMREDVERLYAAMDVYVLASHREGFPRSAMEAAAMGLPIVATDIRGCRQIVDDGRTGLLVPVQRADRLAQAMERLVTDRGRRRTLGAAGRAKAQAEFDDRRQVEITLNVYAEMLARGRKGAVIAPPQRSRLPSWLTRSWE